MNLATLSKNIFLPAIIIFLLFIAGKIHTSQPKPLLEISKQDSAINFNDDMVMIFSAGQKRLITDLLWITTLLESDIEHYSKKDLNSWMYLRFKLIVKLDPLFLSAYGLGGKYLSIIKNDILGAKEIFDQGLQYYPDDYNLIYDTAYLYAFELGDYKKASSLYKKLATYPQAPNFILSLAEKIEFEIHQDLDLAYQIVEKMWKDSPEGSELQQKLHNDLYRIKAEKDLNCLNANLDNCSKSDLFGNPYIFENSKYRARYKFKLYRFRNRIKKD